MGPARGFLYPHGQCDPKIIHTDVKLDNDFEVMVADSGMVKPMDHRNSHVATSIRAS